MSSKTKGLIIGLVFAVCLGVVFLALKLTEPKEDTGTTSDSSTSSTEEVNYIYDFEQAAVEKVVVTNLFIDEKYNGEMNIEKLDDTTWQVAEAEGFSQATSYTSALANCASTIKYNTLVEENAEDLAKYGLTEPNAQFTVTFTDGTERSVSIGNVSPQAEYYYVCETGKNTVYTVLSNNLYYFFAMPEDFVRTLLVEEPENAEDWPYLNEVTIEREDLPGTVVIVADEDDPDDDTPTMVAAQKVIAPVYAYLDITNSSSVTHGIWGLTASEIVTLHPDEIDLAIGGIDKPTAVVNYTCDDGELTYKLIIGSPIYATDDEGNALTTIESYYGYFEGLDALLKLEASTVPWASFTIAGITSSMMTANYVNSIDYMTISITDGENDNLYEFDLSYDKTAEILSVTMNGEEMDEDYFKDFYLFFLKCPATEIHVDDPTTECRMTITIVNQNGSGDTLEFYQDTARRTIVKLNGQTSFRQETSYIELLIANLKSMETRGEIGTTW